MSKLIIAWALTACLIFCQQRVFAQKRLLEQLNASTLPFQLNNEGKEMKYLDSLLKNKSVVALGEETHCTGDFFTAKRNIIQYGVTNLQFKSILIEADFTGTKVLNDYITKGMGSAEEGLFKTNIPAWYAEEVRDLMVWLRNYNVLKPKEEQVTICGFDLQFAKNSIEALKEKFIEPELLPIEPWNFLDSIRSQHITEPMQQAKWKVLENKLLQQRELFSGQDGTEFDDLLMLLREYISFRLAKKPLERDNVRDHFMAENIKLLYKRNTVRTFVWAHNEHISKSKNKWDWHTVGSQLNQYLGSLYYVVVLHTATGEIGFHNDALNKTDTLSISPKMPRNSINRFLSKADRPSFFMDLKEAEQTGKKMRHYLRRKHLTRSVNLMYDPETQEYQAVSYYMPAYLLQKADAILFIRETKGAHPLLRANN